ARELSLHGVKNVLYEQCDVISIDPSVFPKPALSLRSDP
ncbi:MAG: hypothetical protein ACJAX2_002277, partial [Celeribacter sp.]